MALDCGHGCKDSRTIYSLEVQRERDGMRYQTVNANAKGERERTRWR